LIRGQSFPGDNGLVNALIFQPCPNELEYGFDRRKQENFHYFVQCSKKPWDDHFQGQNAKGKYLYLGKYRRVQEDPDSEISETSRTFLFSQLSVESKRTMAEQFHKCQYTEHWVDGGNHKSAGPEDILPYLTSGGDAAASRHEIVQAWITMLEDMNYRIQIVPVEFVEYDEELYNALVAIEAYNGEVSTRFEDIGPV